MKAMGGYSLAADQWRAVSGPATHPAMVRRAVGGRCAVSMVFNTVADFLHVLPRRATRVVMGHGTCCHQWPQRCVNGEFWRLVTYATYGWAGLNYRAKSNHFNRSVPFAWQIR